MQLCACDAATDPVRGRGAAVTAPARGAAEASAMDPEALSRAELIDEVRALRLALAGRQRVAAQPGAAAAAERGC